jgi:preprotein translocase SecE subunit
MAVAAEPETKTIEASWSTPLWLSGLFGAVFVLGSLAIVLSVIPMLWKTTLFPDGLGNALVNGSARLTVQILAAIALLFVASKFGGGKSERHGIRGSIFLMVSTIITVFFLARAVGAWAGSSGQIAFPIAAVVFSVLFYLFFLTSRRFAKIANAIDDTRLLHTTSFKPRQGQKLRRFTILGILAIAGSGIWTLLTSPYIIGSTGSLSFSTPYGPLPVLPDVKLALPFVLAFAAIWFAWRVVNMPSFGDFLIATEAEMNKVSWSTRKQLIRDTIVVLFTVFFLTVFIVVADLVLFKSLTLVNVLPSQSAAAAKAKVDDQDY